MQRFSLLILMVGFIYVGGRAQTLSDFESVLTEMDTFLNGSDGSGGFEVGNVFLNNVYDTEFEFWSGWAISNKTDVTTPGFTNQYSCIAGSGVNGSSAYAVTFVNQNCLLSTVNAAESGVVNGFYINNSTYTYLSMQDGDAFAKKFGGEEGTDPDFLYVTIKEKGDRDKGDSLNVFLADFRSDNSADDYILDEWTYVDLTIFENVDTLTFEMHSSDVGAFGINTPTYFCMDNMETADMGTTAVEGDLSSQTSQPYLYPNPASTIVRFSEPVSGVEIYDQLGQLIQATDHHARGQSVEQWDLSDLSQGAYRVVLKGRKGEILIKNLIRI